MKEGVQVQSETIFAIATQSPERKGVWLLVNVILEGM
jgi:hypothetical protein